MTAPIISVENLGKKYLLSHRREPYTALRDVITEGAVSLASRLCRPFRGAGLGATLDTEEFWALRDVSFEVEQGDRIGIIGRNGAGKSTLLKILSRITEPSTGRVRLKGRVASLLEVGTGFHPELTGRQNIFLNGAILGMGRDEIRRKFDAIVDFAEVERFLDTPVKRYSSGMYVRLAFAVAAHLEPEILIVDEVLAVGDAQFQKKCLGKMEQVGEQGRTVLFVSHNMASIQQLCTKGILLNAGSVQYSGGIQPAVAAYLQNLQTVATETELALRSDRSGNGSFRFTRVACLDRDGNEIQQVLSGQELTLRFYYESEREVKSDSILVAFNVRSSQGYLLSNLNSKDAGESIPQLFRKGYVECSWPRFNLRSGIYSCTLFCSVGGEVMDMITNAFLLNVEDGDYYDSGSMIGREQGEVLIDHTWNPGGRCRDGESA
jgi:lipopolysaccharide transport system ATP-binding protein